MSETPPPKPLDKPVHISPRQLRCRGYRAHPKTEARSADTKVARLCRRSAPRFISQSQTPTGLLRRQVGANPVRALRALLRACTLCARPLSLAMRANPATALRALDDGPALRAFAETMANRPRRTATTKRSGWTGCKWTRVGQGTRHPDFASLGAERPHRISPRQLRCRGYGAHPKTEARSADTKVA